MQDQDTRSEPRIQDAVAIISHVRLTQVVQTLRGLVAFYDATGRVDQGDALREILNEGATVDGVPAPLHTPPGEIDKLLCEELNRAVAGLYTSEYLAGIHQLKSDPYQAAALALVGA